ncbi:DUF6600 domain-containing protein [Acidisoma silvae]|uniref:FecR protein domain-containing protein n=1 Tax=Acidisoma silvae TaxID=2802396 RepID=A0A964DY08_9PROT|nr:DUF6600 domain-containing protein [Acidisoma silvae]MCB8874845.1 hypothetical protein [Acidisoma silvae]
MSYRVRWSLVPTVIASIGLVSANLAASAPAFAQAAPPPAPPGATANTAADAGDPPARVGWLSNLSGAVSFHSASQNAWATATQNYPVATGDAVWTQPQAQASVMIDSSRIALAGGTELTAQEIDQSTITAALSQGEIFLNIVALENGQSVVIQTPRGTAQITGAGQYEIFAGDSNTPTYVTAVTGAIQFTGLGASGPQAIAAQQTLVVSGTNPVQAQLGGMQQDQFLTSMLQQAAPPPPPTATAAPPVTAQMTGASVLTQYGSWSQQAGVGAVWFPQVASSWVPYRDGHWAYVQPWGWTWVDNAPWGFAPFHYGRWAQYGDRWGWVPEPAGDPGYNEASYQPVYAPALVTFIGAAAGVLTAAAFASGAIGWAPLGPREAYYPPYPVSPRYFGAYNRPYVQNYNQFYQRNVTVVNNRISYRDVGNENNGPGAGGGFYNRQGATFAPRDAMVGGRPIATVAHGLPQGAQVQAFRPGAGGGGQHGLPPAPQAGQQPHGAAAPGPAFRPIQAGEAGGRRAAPPMLVAHGAVAPSFHGGGQLTGGQPVPGARPAAMPQPHAPQAGPPGIAAHNLPALAPAAGHAAAAHPQAMPMQAPMQAHAAPGQPQAPRPAAIQPGQPPRTEAARPTTPPIQAPRTAAPRPAPQAPRAVAPRMEAPRAEAPRAEAPRVQAPRPAPAPRVEAPRPAAPRVEMPRPAPAPRMEAPRPAPHAEAPRPAPHGNPPRPPQH